MQGFGSWYRQSELAATYSIPRMCCSFRLCRIGPLPPAKASPGEWMFFSCKDDFGSLHFDEHAYAFVWVVALHCSRNAPNTRRQLEHLITHNARLSHIILHGCKHRINSMERSCLLVGWQPGCPDAAQWNTKTADQYLLKSCSRRPWRGGSSWMITCVSADPSWWTV